MFGFSRAVSTTRVVLGTLLAVTMLAGAAQAQNIFTVTLDGAHEVPPTPSPGTGQALCTLNPAKTNLHIELSVAGLTGAVTACHVHRGAIGVNGPVVFNIGPFVGSIVVDWIGLAPADVADLEAGNLYINVHTVAFAGGEIRGQILNEELHAGILSGAQEVPPFVTPGTGQVTCVLNEMESTLVIKVKAAGLLGAITACHVHNAPVGVSGPSCSISAPSPIRSWRRGPFPRRRWRNSRPVGTT